MILRLKLIEHGWLTDKMIDYIVNVSDKYRWKLVLSNFGTTNRLFTLMIKAKIQVTLSLSFRAPLTFPRKVPPVRWMKI